MEYKEEYEDKEMFGAYIFKRAYDSVSPKMQAKHPLAHLTFSVTHPWSSNAM